MGFRFGARKALRFLRLKILELQYLPHVEIRLVHDKTYAKGGAYKNWTDKKYSSAIHRAVFLAFIASFAVFSVFQTFLPVINWNKPNVARAGANSKTWTTRGDFNNGTLKSGSPTITGTSDVDDATLKLTANNDFAWKAEGTATIGAPAETYNNTAIWTGETGNPSTSNRMITWGGYYNKNTGGIYNPADDSWASTSTVNSPGGRYKHQAVWTGDTGNLATSNRMIIWGGSNGSHINTGGIYNPADNNWSSLLTPSLSGRIDFGMVWTGETGDSSTSHRMIIWGGDSISYSSGDGAIYNPATNSWSAVSTSGAPTPRGAHYTVWTGNTGNPDTSNKMVVWGGVNCVFDSENGNCIYYNADLNIHIYDPATNSWSTQNAPNPPVARTGGKAHWTGQTDNPAISNKLIVWGGYTVGSTGGVYSIDTNSWTPITTVNAPIKRYDFESFWTGSKMIVWGGAIDSSPYRTNTGGIYDLATDSWTNTPATNAPTARFKHAGVWTGNNGIVWGGYLTSATNTGGILSPVYTSPATISNFKINATAKATWSNISWNGTEPANTNIKFRTRGADTEAGLASATWSSYYETSGATITTAASQWLETELTLESSDGANTPTLNDFTVTYDTLEAPTNNNLILTKTDGTSLKSNTGTTITGGVAGAWTNETSLRVTANNLTCGGGDSGQPACATASTNLRPQVQVSTTADTGFATPVADVTATPGNNYANITGLNVGTSYHLRVRAVDDEGRVSGWTSYGANAENLADFTIDQSAPTVTSFTINDGDTYTTSTSVTLTLSATDTGGSALSQMRFSNDGTTWSDWETYATTKAWVLSEGDGQKNVYAQFRDNAGNVSGEFQTSQADFNTGTYNSSQIGTSTNALRLIGPGGSYNNTAYLNSLLSFSPGVPTGVVRLCEDDDYNGHSVYAKVGSGSPVFFYFNIVFAGEAYTYVVTKSMPIPGGEATTITVTTECGDQVFTLPSGYKFNGTNLDLSLTLTFGDNGFNEYVDLNMGINTKSIGTITANIPSTSTYTSKVFGTDSPMAYEKINWNSSETGGSSVNIQFRAGNDNTPDDGTGDWSAWSSNLTKDQSLSSYNGRKYYQYRAILNSGTNQTISPELQDITIITATSDSITLDTAPPTAFNISSPTTPTYSSTVNNPTFSWGASTGHSKYQLFIDNVLNRDNISADATTTTASAPLTEAAHTWTIKALDDAGNITTATNGPFNYVYDTTVPNDVTGLIAPKAQATADSIRVSWSAVTDTSGIAYYRLERKRSDDNWAGDGGTYATFNVSDTSKVDTGLEVGRRYNYRIKAYDNSGLVSVNYATVDGFTVDTVDPSYPSGVTVAACTKTGTNCATADNPNPEAGYSLKVTWNEATDNGTGVTGYKIYRTTTQNTFNPSDFAMVGYYDVVTPGQGGLNLVWYDNDTNNDATFSDATTDTAVPNPVKTTATTRLNDYATYYYRISAIDDNGNEKDLIDPVYYFDNYGYTNNRTVDVTNPGTPADLNATATGTDDSGVTQKATVNWTASLDARTPGRVPAGNGSGISFYTLYRAVGNINGPTESFSQLATNITATVRDETGLLEDTYYYYKVKATDNAGNESILSDSAQVRTRNSSVPSTPSNLVVTAKTGNPNTDAEVGSRVDISFTGSKIKVVENRIDGYRLYRATSATGNAAQCTNFTLVHTFSDLNIPGETQDGARNYTDTVPADATTYCYKAIAYGFNVANNEDVESSLSAVTPGTLRAGWDVVPDATAPDQPQEVTVKDIHSNDSLYRNIVTWQMIADSTRAGASDFAKYQIYRYQANQGIGTATLIAENTNRGDNFHVDGIPAGSQNIEYGYYVIAIDNADANFKYPAPNDATVINNYANISGYAGTVTINPGTVRPTVSATTTASVGVSSATITWTTDQNCDSLVEYRVKGTETVVAAGKNRTSPVTNHSVGLVGLEKGKVYQYRVVSKNFLGNTDAAAATTWYEFTTQDFTVSNPVVTATTTTATVTWTTNINADSSVEYKPESSTAESSTAGDPILSTNHEVVIKGLKPATTYTYKIRSVSADNYITDTNFSTFTTKPFDSSQFTIAPSASNVAEENITATSAKIIWNTAIETDTWVDFGTKAGTYSQSAGNELMNTVHVVELKNLTPGTTYYYRVRGRDLNFVEYTSKEYSFTAVLKPEISGQKIDINTPYSAIIAFNTNVDTEASVTYGKAGNFDLKAGTTEFKRNHVITLENLEDNTTYSYFVEVRDKLGNGQRSATASFVTPFDREGPKVQNLKIDLLPMGESDEFAQVIISWNTNKPSTTKLEYDEGMISTKYGKSTIEDPSLNSSHTVIIKDLTPSSTYHFRVAGKDKRGNATDSADYNFVTPEKNKSVWQLIVRSLEETFSWVKNVGGFFQGIGRKAQ